MCDSLLHCWFKLGVVSPNHKQLSFECSLGSCQTHICTWTFLYVITNLLPHTISSLISYMICSSLTKSAEHYGWSTCWPCGTNADSSTRWAKFVHCCSRSIVLLFSLKVLNLTYMCITFIGSKLTLTCEWVLSISQKVCGLSFMFNCSVSTALTSALRSASRSTFQLVYQIVWPVGK